MRSVSSGIIQYRTPGVNIRGMKTESDEILQVTLDCLRWHIQPRYGDRTAFDAFRRLIAKNIRANGRTPHDHADVHPEQIESRRELRSTAELTTLALQH